MTFFNFDGAINWRRSVLLGRVLRYGCLVVIAASFGVGSPAAGVAQDSAGAVAAPVEKDSAAAKSAPLSVELNKLETVERGCRAYVVVMNSSDTSYQSFKLDLVLFQTDGVIGRRFALDLAPLKPNKRVVKLFDLDNIACDRIGSLLVNDILECKADAGPVGDCLARMRVTSLAPKVELSK